MPTRMSSFFLRTLREDPADAEVPSHRLLVRGGYVRRVAPGIFTWLPLGWKVYRNVERVVREQMDAAGFQELHFPALLPRGPYEASNRWTEYGDNVFRVKDRRDNDFMLGPTHEEFFTLTVKDLYDSYRDLPLAIYQIQTKYRDESRPRAGILRGREFVMKDSYSFDLDDAGLDASYERHRAAYESTFDRLGLEYVTVSAMSGAMGGSASEEFLAPCDSGEDTYVACTSCDYAANAEAVRFPVADPVDATDAPAAHVEDTPETPTIQTLVDLSNGRDDLARDDREWTAADTLKNVVVMISQPDGTREPLAIGVPGDRDVDMKRLEAEFEPAVVEAFTPEDFAAHPQLAKGYIGPGEDVLGQGGIRYLLDPRIAEGSRWITGANAPGNHVYDLVAGRDFPVEGRIDVADIREGDPCPNCGGDLTLARGIEVGHIFKLGRRYAEALDLTVQDESGTNVVVTMGSYGIGVSRAVAAIVEQSHDDAGMVWPRSVTPFDVHLLTAGKSDDHAAAAESLAAEIEAAGMSVLYDDRDASAGVKFNDADLLGMPTIVVVGRGLKNGEVEVKDRATGDRRDVPFDALVETLVADAARA
ncbi:proline--tRNA ligase [Salsipaludibacter albus]|uniref:proline--tRNA ligase n=1 Tax=Salsipaludibacter albus TaxID=2849650 RepID=UPI001EE4CF69|nr:proline--tRNA ligase [Salsipaludibacter albus]MBY5162561.1 proline--tRNA ligase [Salsipaludibacter albus]